MPQHFKNLVSINPSLSVMALEHDYIIRYNFSTVDNFNVFRFEIGKLDYDWRVFK